MAAYAALVSLHQTLEQICQDPHHLLHHLHQQAVIQTMLEHLTILQVQESIEKLPRNCSRFEDQIRDNAYQAEDIIERCISKIFFSGRREAQRWISNIFFYMRRKAQIRKMIRNLQTVAEKLETIVEESKKIEVNTGSQNVKFPMVPLTINSPATEIFGGRGEDVVLGIEEESMKIKQHLLGESSSQLEIISIVGMGGIGKTTLAKTVYKDRSVLNHFDVRVWITVSQAYDPRGALLSLLDSSQENNQHLSNEQLAIQVHRRLKKRRYLVVLDDIWNALVWDDINKLLPKDGCGSWVVLTTRQTDVAAYTNSYIHNMPLMDEDRSWDLLKEKVFGGHGKCPIKWVDIGITIAKKCRGLPLVIIVIAGILQVNKTLASWNDIADDVNSAMVKNDDQQVLDILSLSYSYLPVWLKPCFLYLGGFSEDFEISVETLIRLWVAEGFLKPRGSKKLEEFAYECLDDLIKRNLVSASKRRRNDGVVKICRVHDVIRKLCIKQSQQENFLHLVSNHYQSFFYNPRRISIFPFVKNPFRDVELSSIRTTLCFDDRKLKLEGYELLRVLHATSVWHALILSEVDMSFPPQLCKLVHLRYLVFSNRISSSLTFKIPAGICNLMNLQTLIISVLSDAIIFPSGIWRLRKLRHLVVLCGDLERSILPDPLDEDKACPLEDLQTLLRIDISTNSGSFLEMIPNIRKLGLQSSYGAELSSEHFIRDLVHLHHLENLNLGIRYTSLSPDVWKSPFPVSLRSVKICRAGIPWQYLSTMFGTLPNLEVLRLRNGACEGSVWETREGYFSKLRMLEIDDSDLRIWKMDSSSHFPCLEHLMLGYCSKLEELPWCMEEMDTLEVIELQRVSVYVVEWAEKIGKHHRDMGNELFRVDLRITNDFVLEVA